MSLNTMQEFLLKVVREHPFENNEYEEGYIHKHMARYRDACDIIAAECRKEGRLLSIGAEPGHIEMLLKEFYGFRHVVGLTFHVSQSFRGRMESFGIKVLECDVEKDDLPAPGESFETVIFLEALEHMFTGVPHALSEMRRVLVPGGVMVLSTPNLAQFRNRIKLLKGKSINWPLNGSKAFFEKPAHMRHNREYTAREVEFLVTSAGLKVEKARYADYNSRALTRFFNSLMPGFRSTMYFVCHR